jgi:predicted AlkP superfamily pyrophosphatase or phosphodiesterase
MMHPTLVLNVVGLTAELLGEHTPHLCAVAQAGAQANIAAITPAVTCSAQATYLTGKPVSEHGIVANGWYFRDLSEVWLWRQSNHLVEGPKVWDLARQLDPAFTVAQMFWWYNMYSTADISVTPRPMYLADGRKLPDCYSFPATLRDELQAELGQFPLFKFWGPMADISCSRWIADAARIVQERFHPTLNLVYLPHLDYNLQRLGPDHPAIAKDLREIDEVCGELIAMAQREGMRVLVLSEYGITKVSHAVHLNRVLREQGWLKVRLERGLELLDPGASQAFAVADHQIAHIYVQDPAILSQVRAVIAATDGVEQVWGIEEQTARQLAHPRSGELVAMSSADRWFSYYYWLDDRLAPDFARTVDIHRKPGYDPVELFLDPKLTLGKLSVAAKLAKRKLGLRALLDVIALDDTLVRGSHGRPTDDPRQGPVLLSSEKRLLAGHERSSLVSEELPAASIPATAVQSLILRHLFEES